MAVQNFRRILDLSFSIEDGLPRWPGDERIFEISTHAAAERDGYFERSFRMLEHYGTHVDAPIHFPPGTLPVNRIPAERLVGPAVVLDVSAESQQDADYLLGVSRVEQWEGRHGKVPPGAIVLLRTGWASRWPDETRYLNMDANGVMHTPGFGVQAVRVLMERGAVGLGIDTMSVDCGASQDYPVHTLALGAELYHIECLADLSAVPESGAVLVVAPIKLAGGSGGPCRVFALLP